MTSSNSPDHYWMVMRGSVVLCHGPKESLPPLSERKRLCADGHQVIVSGEAKADTENVRRNKRELTQKQN